MKNCVFAGTFDPFTNGHKKITEICKRLFDKVYVVVGENPDKSPFFPPDVRLAAISAEFEGDDAVETLFYSDVENYAEFLKQNGVVAYIRGIRNTEDFLFERRAEEKNRKIYPEIVTLYLSADGCGDISSTAVRGVIRDGGDFSKFVPPKVYAVISEYLKKRDIL